MIEDMFAYCPKNTFLHRLDGSGKMGVLCLAAKYLLFLTGLFVTYIVPLPTSRSHLFVSALLPFTAVALLWGFLGRVRVSNYINLVKPVLALWYLIGVPIFLAITLVYSLIVRAPISLSSIGWPLIVNFLFRPSLFLFSIGWIGLFLGTTRLSSAGRLPLPSAATFGFLILLTSFWRALYVLRTLYDAYLTRGIDLKHELVGVLNGRSIPAAISRQEGFNKLLTCLGAALYIMLYIEGPSIWRGVVMRTHFSETYAGG